MKGQRHATILDIVDHETVRTQEDLANALRARGIVVTQATVSRDIRELRLIKVLSEDGTYKYASAGRMDDGMGERFIRIFTESVLSINSAENIIVIKTLTGSANAAAEAIDALNWAEVVGSLAGDNTILVVVRDVQSVPDVVRRFRGMMK